MATNKRIFIVFLVALVGSNGFWLYQSIDAGISYTYMEASATDCHRMLQVAVAVIPVIADPESSKADVVNVAEDISGADSFEKDGLVWISGVGLGFNKSNRVAIASDVPLNSFWPPT